MYHFIGTVMQTVSHVHDKTSMYRIRLSSISKRLFSRQTLSGSIPFLFPTVVWAARDWNSIPTGTRPCIQNDVATIQCLEAVFVNVIQGVLGLAIVGLFIMILTAGFRYLMSGGDPKGLEKAKGTLTNALLGATLVVCAYLILRTIAVFTGLGPSLLRFEIPE